MGSGWEIENTHLNADHHELLPWDSKKSTAHLSEDMNSNRISCKYGFLASFLACQKYAT
jgi:hypothetical protein